MSTMLALVLGIAMSFSDSCLDADDISGATVDVPLMPLTLPSSGSKALRRWCGSMTSSSGDGAAPALSALSAALTGTVTAVDLSDRRLEGDLAAAESSFAPLASGG